MTRKFVFPRGPVRQKKKEAKSKGIHFYNRACVKNIVQWTSTFGRRKKMGNLKEESTAGFLFRKSKKKSVDGIVKIHNLNKK